MQGRRYGRPLVRGSISKQVKDMLSEFHSLRGLGRHSHGAVGADVDGVGVVDVVAAVEAADDKDAVAAVNAADALESMGFDDDAIAARDAGFSLDTETLAPLVLSRPASGLPCAPVAA